MKNIFEETKPIFIIGAKRGGTTLMRRVVDAHSKISIPPPGWLHHYIKPYVYSYGDLSVDENMLAMIHDALRIPMIKEYWAIDETPMQVMALLPERSFRGLQYILTRYYTRSTGKNIGKHSGGTPQYSA